MYLFKKRTNAPYQNIASDVLYYFSDNNIYYASGLGMPNCTAYALGRVNELLDLNSLPYPQVKGKAGSGGNWGDTGYIGEDWIKSDKPMLGAIAVFTQSGEAGHVAIVEAVHDNGLVDLSNSGWSEDRSTTSSTYFFIRNNIDVNNWWTYKFKYYLYPPYINDYPTSSKNKSIIPLMICGALSNRL